MVRGEPMKVKRKTPPLDGFGATFKAGGQYTKGGELAISDPEFAELREVLAQEVPQMMSAVGLEDTALPLVWTIELLPGGESSGSGYVVGEIDCECVSFTTQLDLCATIAAGAVELCSAGSTTTTSS